MPTPTPHPLIVKIKDILDPVHGVFRRKCAALVVPFAGTNGAFRRKMVGERFENADKSRTDSSPIQGESSFKEKCTSCLQSNGRTVMWIQIHPCPYFYLCPYLPGCTLLVSSVLSWDITACLRSLISQLWTIFTNISAMTLSYCFCYGRSTSVQIFCYLFPLFFFSAETVHLWGLWPSMVDSYSSLQAGNLTRSKSWCSQTVDYRSRSTYAFIREQWLIQLRRRERKKV